MLFINGHWLHGTREVKYAESVIHKSCSEIMTHLYNWPDTNTYNIEINEFDEDHFILSGKIEYMLVFIYNFILNYKNYTLADILQDQKELIENAEIYFKKVW